MEYLEYIKSIHLISIIIWIIGLVYLLKVLYFHQAQLKTNVNSQEKLIKEEVFVYRYVMSTSFLSAILFGCLLIVFNKSLLQTGMWIYIKFFFISILAIIHHLCKIYMIKLKDNNVETKDETYNKLIIYSFLCLSIVVLLTTTKFI